MGLGNIICQVVNIYLLVLVVRIVLSYFPLQRGGPIDTFYGLLYSVTEPVLAPMRRVIPPVGGFDLSPLILFFGAQLIC